MDHRTAQLRVAAVPGTAGREDSRSEHGLTYLSKFPRFFGSSARRTSLNGRPVGCLSLLDPGESDRVHTLPSPARSMQGELSTSYARIQARPTVPVSRPRAVLSSPENDELTKSKIQHERSSTAKNASKVALPKPEKIQDLSNNTIAVSELPKAPLTPMDDFPSEIMTSLEEFSKTTGERTSLRKDSDSSTDISSRNPSFSSNEGVCAVKVSSFQADILVPSDAILNHPKALTPATDNDPLSILTMAEPIKSVSDESESSQFANKSKIEMGQHKTSPEQAHNQTEKKKDRTMNKYRESKQNPPVITDACYTNTVTNNANIYNPSLANQTVKKKTDITSNLLPYRVAKQQPSKAMTKGNVKPPRPWY